MVFITFENFEVNKMIAYLLVVIKLKFGLRLRLPGKINRVK